jgi:transposase
MLRAARICGTRGRAVSSPDNAGTCQHRQMARVRQARREGVTTVNQCSKAPQAETICSNLTDRGWVAARTRIVVVRGTPVIGDVVGREAMPKVCGVGVARLQGRPCAGSTSCSRGRRSSASSTASGSRAPARGVPAWPAGCVRRAWSWSRSTGPNRRTRRRHGKSDGVDALAAARAVQSKKALGVPKAADGDVEAIRILRVAYRSAVKATHPGRQPAARPGRHRTPRAARPAPGTAHRRPRHRRSAAAARRHARHDHRGHPLHPAEPGAPLRVARGRGRGSQRADDPVRHQRSRRRCSTSRAWGRSPPARCSSPSATIPKRLRSEESFAHLCGAAPLDASSGKQQRHRLNRGGDRQANCALHTIAVVRMSHDETTRTYIARRIADGKTKREAIRCLERYIARDIHRILVPVITPKALLTRQRSIEGPQPAVGVHRCQGRCPPTDSQGRGEPRGEWPRRVASTVHRPFPSWREARPQPPLSGAPGRFVEGGPREAPPLG